MVLKPAVVQRRLEELDWTLQRLARLRDIDPDAYKADVDLQWIAERGLLNAAGLVFDVADHVLSGHFGHHPETYQGSLDGLHQEGVNRAFRVFPRFAREILAWMDDVGGSATTGS